jgi:hypothetical protein
VCADSDRHECWSYELLCPTHRAPSGPRRAANADSDDELDSLEEEEEEEEEEDGSFERRC